MATVSIVHLMYGLSIGIEPVEKGACYRGETKHTLHL